jgi:transcriptional regulator with XRE-family HTH domain
LSNVNQTTIARWENEEISPSLDNIYDVANVLNVSIANLTGRDLTDEQPVFDELELIFSKNKDILTDDDKETIKFVIEKARRKVNEQLDKK